MKNKSLKILLIASVIASISIIAVIRFITLNRKIPNAKTETYYLNDCFEYNGLEICINKFDSIDFKESDPEILDKIPSLKKYEGRIFFVRCHVKNKTNSEQSFDFTNYIQSKAYSTYFDLTLFEYYNEPKIMTLEPGEERDFVLPYTVYSFNFREKDRINLKDREFDFVLTIYPVKRVVKLKSKQA